MAVDLGDLYRTAWTNLGPGGALGNADSVTLTITLPDGTADVQSGIAPASTGKYQYDYLTVQPGRHIARWVGTGANPGAYVEVFDVREENPPSVISLADAKQQLNITSDTSDDELSVYIEAATAAIERHLDRAVARRTVIEQRDMGMPEVYGAPGILQHFTLTTKPVVSLTSVASADGFTTWPVDTNLMQVTPTGVVRVLNGSIVWGPVVFTYEVGMAVIPANIQLAARIIVQHLWESQRGSRGGPLPGGLNTPGEGMTLFGFSIPNRALELLGPSLSGIA